MASFGCRSLTVFVSLWLSGDSALPEEFRVNINNDKDTMQQLLRRFGDLSGFCSLDPSEEHCEAEAAPASAAACCVMTIRRFCRSDLSCLPRDVVRIISRHVWRSRLSPEWAALVKKRLAKESDVRSNGCILH